MKTVLVTGSQGFIGSYLCKQLLDKGYKVIGIDNFSKYGKLTRPHDNHKNFEFVEWDAQKLAIHADDFKEVDYIIACAAMIGGISYFHKYAYDLLATNERIMASTFDMAIYMHKKHNLKRIVVLSSSMVFENTSVFPTPEDQVTSCPPPFSSYGFQKLACEYFAKAAWEQYKLPYTIVRPFNCVGVGEEKALGEAEVQSGNVKLMMSHVLPDLIHKVLSGQDPIHILGEGTQTRCYTNGKDIATGIILAMESDKAENNDFNISTSQATSVVELAEIVWKKINSDKPFICISDPAFEYDVEMRIPDITKAKEILGFEAKISLDESVDEVISYMRVRHGTT